MQIKIVALNARFTHSCLALFHVRNELEKKCPGMDTELCQLTINDSYYETLLRLSQGDPDYIFFSAAVWNSDRVEQLIHDLKGCLPDCGVVVGGPQAVVIGRNLSPASCTVVSGDMEAVSETFYRDLETKNLQPLYGGSFLQMQDRVLLSPYREEDFSLHLRNRNIYYESSRGCPFSCSYCLSSAEKGVYHKELGQVQQELAQILRYRPVTLRFVDRTFNDRPERALAIWKFLMGIESETLFHFEITPDRFTEEMFDFLHSVPVGRFQFEIGVQSTHHHTLQAVGRMVDLARALRNIKRLVLLGSIHLHVDLILGLPYETKDEFYRSFAELFATGAHYLQMGLLKLLPGTAISRDAENFSYVSCKQPPYAVLANHWLDHAVLRELYWFCECVEKFVNNRYFPSLWEYLRSKGEDVASFFQELLRICQEENFFALAVTQEFMGQLLSWLIQGREDGPLLLEILRYDWLRCGHRFLPSYLQVELEEEQPLVVRNELYQQAGSELAGVFDQGSRKQFLKKGFCLRFSGQCLRELGLSQDGERAVIIFLPEREVSLYRLNKTVVVTSSKIHKSCQSK
ncbi:MAG: DUF4080 domain-containing protein [Desulfocapsaceae bacterium]|nr:DUF4080 domain-containing protein [Desulfocapsaceae bacterium]